MFASALIVVKASRLVPSKTETWGPLPGFSTTSDQQATEDRSMARPAHSSGEVGVMLTLVEAMQLGSVILIPRKEGWFDPVISSGRSCSEILPPSLGKLHHGASGVRIMLHSGESERSLKFVRNFPVTGFVLPGSGESIVKSVRPVCEGFTIGHMPDQSTGSKNVSRPIGLLPSSPRTPRKTIHHRSSVP